MYFGRWPIPVVKSDFFPVSYTMSTTFPRAVSNDAVPKRRNKTAWTTNVFYVDSNDLNIGREVETVVELYFQSWQNLTSFKLTLGFLEEIKPKKTSKHWKVRVKRDWDVFLCQKTKLVLVVSAKWRGHLEENKTPMGKPVTGRNVSTWKERTRVWLLSAVHAIVSRAKAKFPRPSVGSDVELRTRRTNQLNETKKASLINFLPN